MKKRYTCLDTSVISALIKNPRNLWEENRQRKAEHLLHALIDDCYDFVIPTVVYGEILTTLEESDQSELGALTKNWIMISYTPYAAKICASNFMPMQIVQRQQENYFRNIFKADQMIMASALAVGVDVIVAGDNHFASLQKSVDDRISVISLDEYEIPTLMEQPAIEFPE